VPAGRLEFPWSTLLFLYLLLIVVVDIEHRLILQITSFAGVLLGLGVGIHTHGVQATVVGGIAGYSIMLLLYASGVVFVRSVSRWRGQPIDAVALGYGDVGFAGVVGLLLGWPGVLQGVLIAMLAAGVISLIIVVQMLVRNQYRAFVAIPYGPFLALSAVFLLLWP
jgi:leader peptidase (prepilin peptidase)/N-methyltransferase